MQWCFNFSSPERAVHTVLPCWHTFLSMFVYLGLESIVQFFAM
jgi:hypothetical protein